MTKERIINWIMMDAESKKDRILAEVDEERKRMEKEAYEAAKRRKKEIMENLVAEGRREMIKKMAENKIKYKKKILNVRESLIEQVFTIAREKFKEMAHLHSSLYETTLKNIIIKHYQALECPELILHCKIQDKELLKEIISMLNLDLEFRIKTDLETIGGLILESADGKRIIDETFENREKEIKRKFRSEVAKILFTE